MSWLSKEVSLTMSRGKWIAAGIICFSLSLGFTIAAILSYVSWYADHMDPW